MRNRHLPNITLTLSPDQQEALIASLDLAYEESYSSLLSSEILGIIGDVKRAQATALAELNKQPAFDDSLPFRGE